MNHPQFSLPEPAIKCLTRAIRLSQNQFSLVLVNCGSQSPQRSFFQQLSQICDRQIIDINLHPSVNNLYDAIEKALASGMTPEAISVQGLPTIRNLEQLFYGANLMREEFRKDFSCPLILWINDDVSQVMTRVAPDFRNWAAPPICVLSGEEAAATSKPKRPFPF